MAICEQDRLDLRRTRLVPRGQDEPAQDRSPRQLFLVDVHSQRHQRPARLDDVEDGGVDGLRERVVRRGFGDVVAEALERNDPDMVRELL
jgi:hypothetical protein